MEKTRLQATLHITKTNFIIIKFISSVFLSMNNIKSFLVMMVKFDALHFKVLEYQLIFVTSCLFLEKKHSLLSLLILLLYFEVA